MNSILVIFIKGSILFCFPNCHVLQNVSRFAGITNTFVIKTLLGNYSLKLLYIEECVQTIEEHCGLPNGVMWYKTDLVFV